MPGLYCWDTNENHAQDPEEDVNGDDSWDAKDCQGAPGMDGMDGMDGADGTDGEPGAPGTSCWDLDDNRICDGAEDSNMDGGCDALDCQHAGPIRQVAYAELLGTVAGAGNIPFDDTIPQQTEGSEFLTVSITPTSESSWLQVELVTWLSETSNHSNHLIAALFRDSDPDAIVAGWADTSHNNVTIGGANNYSDSSLVLKARVPAGSVATTTFRFRAGCDGGPARVNGIGSEQRLGGSLRTTLTVVEVAQ